MSYTIPPPNRPRVACPANGCARKMRQGLIVCSRCWFRLPPRYRRAIGSTRPGTDDRETEAAAALRWLHHHLPPSAGTRRRRRQASLCGEGPT